MPNQVAVKTILNKSKKRDKWFLDDYTLNPYSGCSFNCLFCYIRGSKYGEHMERSVSIKSNAVDLLEKQLFNKSKKEEYGIIVLSSATDPYLHFEKEYGITREVLKLILKYRFPVHILTRSNLIQRDFDLLKEIDQKAILPSDLRHKMNRGSILTFSFSTLDDELANVFEPGATPPSKRLEALSNSINEGFLSGVSMMPLLPYLSDTTESLNHMFQTFKSVGVHYLFPATLTLFGNQPSDSKVLTFRAIEKHYPHLLPKYQKLFATHHGLPAYYQKAFYEKMKQMSTAYQIPDCIIEF
jgi:DNA repair photolyase